jgi:hypothetical protein
LTRKIRIYKQNLKDGAHVREERAIALDHREDYKMKTKLLSGACLLILSTVSAEAFAQNASQSASAAGQVESERKLSTVTVTAEKRDESLLDVGASITAIGE